MYEQIRQDYHRAFDLVEKTNNHKLKGLIQYNLCRLNMIEGSYNEALQYPKNANQFFKLIPNEYDYYIDELNLTVNVFLYLSELDSALFYYTSAFDTVTFHQGADRQRNALQNMSVAYCDAEIFYMAALICW